MLIKEVRANASSVHSDLGGGEDGHLALVCKPEVYATLAAETDPYVRLENSGRLQLEEGLAQYPITQWRDKHVEDTRVFCKVLGVDQAI